MEAEYISVSDAYTEATTQVHLYLDLDFTAQPPLLLNNSTSALSLMNESKVQVYRVINTQYHYIHDILQKGEI